MYAVINPLILLVAPVDAVLTLCTLPHHTKGNDITLPHENEYLAAIAGMADHTMPPAPQPPAIGDFVSGLTAGRRWSGHIEWFSDDGKTMVVNVDHSWVTVPVADIAH